MVAVRGPLARWESFRAACLPRAVRPRGFSSSPASRAAGFIRRGGGGEEPYVPVLIVGAGPVGLVLSILLTKLGVKCTIVERSTVFTQHPQAHFINNRSMELFRKIGGLAEEIQRLQPPVDLWRKFIYCTSLSGSILGSVDHMQPQDFKKIASPVSVAHFSQYKLIRLLFKEAKNLGFAVCNPYSLEGLYHYTAWTEKIFMGHECISINPTAEGVTVGLSFLEDGKMATKSLHCSILVGCDGSRSTVRKLVGIEMEGERDLQNLVSVHFLSRELGQYLLDQRPGMLFFIFNPEAIGVLVAHDLKEGEFVLQIPYYPPQQKFEDFNSKVCEQIIFKLAGKEFEDVQVLDIKPWVMHAEVAEKFVACNNRVILAGDAAHRFPPAGGFGMNTGIQDAHNLAWKIGSLFQRVSSPSILQTYEMERKPIAYSNAALSIRNFKAAMSVPAALGLDPTIANSVHQVLNSSISSILPSGVQKAVLEGLFFIGRAQLSQFILNENNPLGLLRLARLKSIFDEGKSLQLQFPAEDLGFRYREGAVIADISGKAPDTVEDSSTCRRESKEYVPSANPGSRLPHMQVRALKASTNEDIFSTLDLTAGDKLEFLLIIAPVDESYDLARVTLKMAEDYGISVKICVIWPQGSSTEQVNQNGIKLDPWTNYIDVEEVRTSAVSWWEMCRMTTKGAILVRPDDHTAWKVESDAIEDLVQETRRVFSAILRADETI